MTMKRSPFNSESTFWKLVGGFGELLILSLMWFLGALPLVTFGASTAALYDTVSHCIRNGESDLFGRFRATYKNELLLSIPCSVLWLCVIIGSFRLYRHFTDVAGTSPLAYSTAIAWIILQITVLGIACWVSPLQSRFTFRFGSLTGTAVRLAVAHIGRSFLLGLMTALSIWLSFRFVLPVMILPGTTILLWTYVIEPVFQ